MLVESYDKEGAEVYEMIIKQIFQDLQLGPSVKDLRAFVDPDEVVFILAIKMDKTLENTLLKEVAKVKYDKNQNKTSIMVNDENYLPNILRKLWIEFGRGSVNQPNRYVIILDGDKTDLKDIVIDSPHANLQKRIYDAIFRIIPEGFKIIKDISEGDVVAIVSTDELIKDKWIEKGKEYIIELNTPKEY